MHFDRIMEKNVENVEQVVIMGAGFDLRVLKYTEGKNVKVFELDQENTQNLKIETMKKMGEPWIFGIDMSEDALNLKEGGEFHYD